MKRKRRIAIDRHDRKLLLGLRSSSIGRIIKTSLDPIKREALWTRYGAIYDRKANGLYEPILWHLALCHDLDAMVALANTFDADGRTADPFSQAGLCYRAHRGGHKYAAQHLAMNAFNQGRLQGYRYWLRRAARFDPDLGRELRRFETRLPHWNAKKIGRIRPYRRSELR